jgi:hypothetical protein
VPNRRRNDRLEACIESLGNLLGDTLKIFSKWYNATTLIADGLFDKSSLVGDQKSALATRGPF